MKKILLFTLVISLNFSSPVHGQAIGTTIDINDRPVALGNDSFSGSARETIKTYINFSLVGMGAIEVASLNPDGVFMVLVNYAVINTVLGSNGGQRALR